jgi:hypothetical protein
MGQSSSMTFADIMKYVGEFLKAARDFGNGNTELPAEAEYESFYPTHRIICILI